MHPCVSLFFLCNIAYVQAIQCARTQDEWNKASASLQCQEPNYYHCLRDENGILTQKCLQRVWIQNGMCPEFNSRVGRIDVFKCQSDENGCPNTIFWSNAVYIYPRCYDKTIPPPTSTTTINFSAILLTSTETQLPENATSFGNKNKENPNMGVIVAIVIFIAIVIIALIVACFIYLHRKKNIKKKENKKSSSFKNISEEEMLDGMDKNVSPRDNRSDQRSEINEEENLLDKANKNVSPRGNQTRQSEQIRETKEQENLIDKTPKYEIPKHRQPHRPDYKRENTEKWIGNLTMKFKKEVYGVHILIFVLRNATVLNENTVKNEAFKELNVEVDMENSFLIWEDNKTKESYYFQDWISSGERYDENDLRKTQLEILQAVEKNNTKFVFVIPFNIWAQHAILKEMESWAICRKKTK